MVAVKEDVEFAVSKAQDAYELSEQNRKGLEDQEDRMDTMEDTMDELRTTNARMAAVLERSEQTQARFEQS